MTVLECDIPSTSVLDRRMVDAAYFRDAYRAPLNRTHASIVNIFFGLFGHHPLWVKLLLIVRNRIASWCGLDAPSAADILRFEVRKSYAVGDTIGVWPIFALTETELVAGRDNKHLDFRLSLLRESNDGVASVTVSTLCVVHNLAGKVYLFFIVPFHRWGVRQMLARAVAAGRL